MDTGKIVKILEEGFKNLKSEVSKEITNLREQVNLPHYKKSVENEVSKVIDKFKHCKTWFDHSSDSKEELIDSFLAHKKQDPELSVEDYLKSQEDGFTKVNNIFNKEGKESDPKEGEAKEGEAKEGEGKEGRKIRRSIKRLTERIWHRKR